LFDEAAHVADPPAGRRELDNVFKSVLVHRIGAQDPFGDEYRAPGDIAFLGQELFFPDFSTVQDGDETAAFIGREVDVAGDMFEQKGMGFGTGKVDSGDYFFVILISSPAPL
jgi:hypothetical protein